MDWEMLSQIATVGGFVISTIAIFISSNTAKKVKIIQNERNNIIEKNKKIENSPITQIKGW